MNGHITLSTELYHHNVMIKLQEDLKSTTITEWIGFGIAGFLRLLINGIHKLIFKHITDLLTDELVRHSWQKYSRIFEFFNPHFSLYIQLEMSFHTLTELS